MGSRVSADAGFWPAPVWRWCGWPAAGRRPAREEAVVDINEKRLVGREAASGSA